MRDGTCSDSTGPTDLFSDEPLIYLFDVVGAAENASLHDGVMKTYYRHRHQRGLDLSYCRHGHQRGLVVFDRFKNIVD